MTAATCEEKRERQQQHTPPHSTQRRFQCASKTPIPSPPPPKQPKIKFEDVYITVIPPSDNEVDATETDPIRVDADAAAPFKNANSVSLFCAEMPYARGLSQAGDAQATFYVAETL